MPYLENPEVPIVDRNFVNNYYQQNLTVLYIFVRNKLLGQLLDTSPRNYIFLKIFLSEFSCIEVRLTDQNCKPLEIEVKVNITLVIN